MKTFLFAYGTLKDTKTQKAVVGRILNATSDILENYDLSTIQLGNNRYPLVIPKNGTHVNGSLLEIETTDFEKLDYYESDAYKRVERKLKSGILAWVYIKNEA